MGDTDESIAVSKDKSADVEESGGSEAAQTSTTAADSTGTLHIYWPWTLDN